jgi:hypothetical protein
MLWRVCLVLLVIRTGHSVLVTIDSVTPVAGSTLTLDGHALQSLTSQGLKNSLY